MLKLAKIEVTQYKNFIPVAKNVRDFRPDCFHFLLLMKFLTDLNRFVNS